MICIVESKDEPIASYCWAGLWWWAKSDSLALLPLQKLLRRPKKAPEVGRGGTFSRSINPLCLLTPTFSSFNCPASESWWIQNRGSWKVWLWTSNLCQGHFRDQKDALQGMTQRGGEVVYLYFVARDALLGGQNNTRQWFGCTRIHSRGGGRWCTGYSTCHVG